MRHARVKVGGTSSLEFLKTCPRGSFPPFPSMFNSLNSVLTSMYRICRINPMSIP